MVNHLANIFVDGARYPDGRHRLPASLATQFEQSQGFRFLVSLRSGVGGHQQDAGGLPTSRDACVALCGVATPSTVYQWRRVRDGLIAEMVRSLSFLEEQARDGSLGELGPVTREHTPLGGSATASRVDDGTAAARSMTTPVALPAPPPLALPPAPVVSFAPDPPAQPSPPHSPAPSIAPMIKPTPVPQPVDIGIVIALPEELRVFLELTGSYEPHPDRNLVAYLFSRGNYRCAVTLVGEMGEAQAAVFTDRLIAGVDPGILVSMGIAGGLNDLLAGDVHVPAQAVQYLQDSKAEATADGGFTIIPGAPAYRPDFGLLDDVRNLEFRHPAEHRSWVEACAADFAALLPDVAKRDRLIAAKHVRSDVRILVDGHVATGPVVGASKAYAGRVRCHDRQIKSIEMESAAVLLAAQNRRDPRRAIAIRAISDFGDEHKKELDAQGDGVLRRYSMRNAVRLLFTLLYVGAFAKNPR